MNRTTLLRLFRKSSLLHLLAGVLCCAPYADAQVTGAIFTTTADGLTVNGNIYDHCCDVYLNGGPGPNAKCTAAGLPDGDYYFQVTDPNGSILLSTDDISQRWVTVTGGIITAYHGASPAPDGCTHNVGSGPCGSLTVQLEPFSNTPNPGGEYKVWMTPVGDYNPTDSSPNFGFVNSTSKTDNFKCRESVSDCPGGKLVCISCPEDVTIPCSKVNGTCVTVNYATPIVLPAGLTPVCDPPSGSCFAAGQTTVVNCSVSDGVNSDSCSFNVTIGACPQCAFTCPEDQIVCTDPGQCSAVVNYLPPTCSEQDVTVNCIPASGSAFPVGTTAVNCQATQGSDVVGLCSFNIVVNDCPTLTCSDVPQCNDPGQCGAVVNFSPTVGNNCGGPILVQIYSGTTQQGGVSFADATVDSAITGGGAPYTGLVTSFGASDVQFGTDTGFNWHPSLLGSFGADITGYINVTADGAYVFTLSSDDGSVLLIDGSTVIDNGGAHAQQTADNSGSPLTLTAGVHKFEVQFFECCGGPSGVDLGLPAGVTYTYNINVACVPPSGSTFSVGAATPVNCTATDASGNTSTCAFNVTVNDCEKPVVTCPGPITATAGSCSTIAIVKFTATATDNCDGPLTPTCSPASGSSFSVGQTKVTCSATDKAGNTGTCCFTVTVNEATSSACGALTMGFWQNKNGQGIIQNYGSGLAGWLTQYCPFKDLSSTASASTTEAYVYTTIKAANAGGASMNAMLKAQMLATALDVYFSTTGLGGNKIGASTGLGALKLDLTKVCKPTDSTSGTATCSGTSENTSGAFNMSVIGCSGSTVLSSGSCVSVSELLHDAALASTSGGLTSWYGNNKTTQGLAKDTFDAFNNGFTFLCP